LPDQDADAGDRNRAEENEDVKITPGQMAALGVKLTASHYNGTRKQNQQDDQERDGLWRMKPENNG
jgi:hypothetical protein